MCFLLTFLAGFNTRQAYNQDSLMRSSCAIISSIHSAEHACSDSTSVFSIHDFPFNTHHKRSNLQAMTAIQERLMCRHAVVMCDFYSVTASIQ